MSARVCFCMILHRECGQASMAHALQRAVVQIQMRQLDVALVQRIGVHGKPMVLRGYFYPPGEKALYGLVSPSVAEFQFERSPSRSQAHELVSDADAVDRRRAHRVSNGGHV